MLGSLRGRGVLRRTPLLVVGAVVASFVAGCGATNVAEPIANGSSGATSGTEPAGFVATIHDFVLIRHVLAERAQAVVKGDEAAFLRTIDPADSTFRASELVMYQNLQKLPVGAMSYESGTSGLLPATVPGNDPTIAPDVTEHVLLQGTDVKAQAVPVDMTFVRRSGIWYLASEGLNAANSTRPVSRLWEGPPISVVKRGGLLVVAEADPAGVAAHVANIVSADLTKDAQVLGIAVESRVLIDLTNGGQLQQFGDNEEAAGVMYPVFASHGGTTTGLAGWRIKVNPDELSQLASYPQLLRHELTHYLLRNDDGASPTWLVEGAAQYVGYYPNPTQALALPAADYSDLMARPRVLLNSGFFGNKPDEDYAEATATVMYLVQQGGITKLITLMHAYRTARGATENAVSAVALKQVYGLTPSQVAQGAFAILSGLS